MTAATARLGIAPGSENKPGRVQGLGPSHYPATSETSRVMGGLGLTVMTNFSRRRQPVPQEIDPTWPDSATLGTDDTTHPSHRHQPSASIDRVDGQGFARAFYTDISPSDRPIEIGFVVDSDKAAALQGSPMSHKASVRSVATPTIIITPAKEVSRWSLSTAESGSTPARSRIASSIYSTSSGLRQSYVPDTDAPPVPLLPLQMPTEAPRQPLGRQGAVYNMPTFGKRDGSRSSDIRDSSCTIFEEDGMSTIAEENNARPAADSPVSPPESAKSSHVRQGLHIEPPTRRPSQDWWNVITTPFEPAAREEFMREFRERQLDDIPEVPPIPSGPIPAPAFDPSVRSLGGPYKAWTSEAKAEDFSTTRGTSDSGTEHGHMTDHDRAILAPGLSTVRNLPAALTTAAPINGAGSQMHQLSTTPPQSRPVQLPHIQTNLAPSKTPPQEQPQMKPPMRDVRLNSRQAPVPYFPPPPTAPVSMRKPARFQPDSYMNAKSVPLPPRPYPVKECARASDGDGSAKSGSEFHYFQHSCETEK